MAVGVDGVSMVRVPVCVGEGCSSPKGTVTTPSLKTGASTAKD